MPCARSSFHPRHPRGYIDDPQPWSFQYSDQELQEYGLKMTLRADALLLGRITCEGMAQAWPTRGGNPFADHVNSTTKYVVASNRDLHLARHQGGRALGRPASTGTVERLNTKTLATGAVVHAYRPN